MVSVMPAFWTSKPLIEITLNGLPNGKLRAASCAAAGSVSAASNKWDMEHTHHPIASLMSSSAASAITVSDASP